MPLPMYCMSLVTTYNAKQHWNKMLKTYWWLYRMEENFGGYKLWRIGKENFIGGINFDELIIKV